MALPEDIIKELKTHGMIVVNRHLNINLDFAIKAEKAGVDILIETGKEEEGTFLFII